MATVRRGARTDYTGRVIGRLTVVARLPDDGTGPIRWSCRCECGGTKVLTAATINYRSTRSCGCLQREHAATFNRTHGRYRDPLYGIWEGIIQRCCNPKHKQFGHYGGRGIRVCARWRQSFEAFAADMGERPGPGYSIDRIDNDGHYEPGNTRWAVWTTQMRNRRTARLITFNGRTETAHMWSKLTGIPSRTVTNRLNAGLTPEQILTTPARGRVPKVVRG